MKRITRRIRLAVVALIIGLLTAVPLYANAATTTTLNQVSEPDLLITEFQTNGGSATQEFIELYNTTDKDIVFTDPTTSAQSSVWKIQFFNSTSVKAGTPDWNTAQTTSNSIVLTGMVPAHEYYIVSSANYKPADVEPDMTYAASSSHLMTDTGGGLQITSTTTTLTGAVATVTNVWHDRLMWLASSSSTPLPENVLVSPGTGKSLQRVPNDDTEYVAEDGIIASFGIPDDITPLAPWQAPIIEPEPIVDPPSNPDDLTDSPATTIVSNAGLTSPLITEVLPNPATPLTDADDEFIELYNPNSSAFDLSGFSLEVGLTTLHDYIFADNTIIEPLTYQPFYSGDTKLSLSNTSGQVKLRDALGQIVSQTTPYQNAKDNQSWVLSDGTWQWTTSATPGLSNLVSTPIVATKTTTTKAATKTKAPTTKKVTAAKTTKAKKTTVKKAKTTKKKVKAAVTAATAAYPEKPKPPIHGTVLVVVGIAAVLYGLYEYRHDITNKFRQLRDDRKARRATRGESTWRRDFSPAK